MDPLQVTSNGYAGLQYSPLLTTPVFPVNKGGFTDFASGSTTAFNETTEIAAYIGKDVTFFVENDYEPAYFNDQVSQEIMEAMQEDYSQLSPLRTRQDFRNAISRLWE